MDPLASIRFLNELENAFPVTSWSLSQVRVWPIVRGELWWAVNSNFSADRRRVRASTPMLRRASQLLEWPANLARWTALQWRSRTDRGMLGHPAGAVILGDSVSRLPVQDRWFDRHTDPFADVLEELGLRSLQLDPHHVYRVPTYRPSVQIQPRMDALWLRNRALPVLTPPQVLDGYSEMLEQVRGRGFEVPSIGPEVVGRQARHLRAVANWFGRVLDRTDARLGLLVDHGLVQMGFNLACGERGIPSIEIQHGVQIGNARYSGWSALPPGGYLELPSHFWCWSEQEATNIRAWSAGCERHQPIVGGNLWLRAWLEGTAPSVEEYDAILQARASPGRTDNDVLVALSTGFTETRQLASLRDAIAAAPDGWQWWIRSHPTMQPSEFELAIAFLRGSGESRIVATAAQELPLYALLRQADVHVTQMSTTVIEAQQFHVPSVVTEPASADLFPEQLASEWMVIAQSGEEILNAIRRQVARTSLLPPPPDPRTLPAPGLLLTSLVGLERPCSLRPWR